MKNRCHRFNNLRHLFFFISSTFSYFSVGLLSYDEHIEASGQFSIN